MFPGWENIIKKVRPSRPQPESTDLHNLRPNIPGGQARSVEARPEGQYGEEHLHTPGGKAREARTLQCPVCQVSMALKQVGPVEIDECSKCGGIFLDRGELKSIAGRDFSTYEKSAQTSTSRDTTDRQFLVYTPHGLSNHVHHSERERAGS